jgi:hypothetical protein
MFSNTNRTDSNEEDSFNKCLNFSLLQEPELHQNFQPEPEPHKNDAVPQHW